jgi:hypothetical protein
VTSNFPEQIVPKLYSEQMVIARSKLVTQSDSHPEAFGRESERFDIQAQQINPRPNLQIS